MSGKALSVVVAWVAAAAGCGGDEVGVPASASYRMDEVRGTFRGIALGDRERRVVARFGPDQREPAGPVSSGPSSPGTFASAPGRPRPDDRTAALRYDGMSFVTNEWRVYVIMSSIRGTRTRRGVRVGDPLSAARRAYRGLKCSTATDAHGRDSFRYCNGRLGPRRFIYFGGDPIGTVAMARVPLYG